jgi:hypothetical protein
MSRLHAAFTALLACADLSQAGFPRRAGVTARQANSLVRSRTAAPRGARPHGWGAPRPVRRSSAGGDGIGAAGPAPAARPLAFFVSRILIHPISVIR